MKLYNLSDRYCKYLRQFDKRIYDNKESLRLHARKYVGVVLKINELNYYIPMSSPKFSDYYDKECTKIRKSTNTIIRMIARNSQGNYILRGTLRISNMIPIPNTELESYNPKEEKDIKYRDIINDEVLFIHKHQQQITKKAQLVYRQKELKLNINYLKHCVNYKLLEEKCLKYKNI